MIVIPVQVERVAIANAVPHNHERLGEEKQSAVPAKAGLYEFFVSLEVADEGLWVLQRRNVRSVRAISCVVYGSSSVAGVAESLLPYFLHRIFLMSNYEPHLIWK